MKTQVENYRKNIYHENNIEFHLSEVTESEKHIKRVEESFYKEDDNVQHNDKSLELLDIDKNDKNNSETGVKHYETRNKEKNTNLDLSNKELNTGEKHEVKNFIDDILK